MGKPAAPVKRKEDVKSPISKGWIGASTPARNLPATCVETDTDSPTVLLAFVLCGGVIFEILRLFF
jgi:hypothetical protein